MRKSTTHFPSKQNNVLNRYNNDLQFALKTTKGISDWRI